MKLAWSAGFASDMVLQATTTSAAGGGVAIYGIAGATLKDPKVSIMVKGPGSPSHGRQRHEVPTSNPPSARAKIYKIGHSCD
jgi:hypothetical protein